MRRSVWLFSLLCAGCGPTEMESGQAVMLAAPFITLVGALVASGFAKLWKPLAPELRFHWRPTLYALCVLTILCTGIIFFPPGSGEWVGAALIFVGSSYLTVQLIMLRVFVHPSYQNRYSIMSLAPWSIFYPPALILAYVGSSTIELQALPGLLWTLPGYGGLVLLPVAFALLVEIGLRRKRHADERRRERLPRPLPEARARFRQE